MAVESGADGAQGDGCLLCGSRQSQTVLSTLVNDNHGQPHRFDLVRCAGCGLGMTRPIPPVERMGQFYPADYRPHEEKKQALGHSLGLWSWGRSDCPERKWLEPFGQARLLDFGCGGGSYLVRMRAQGWKVTGIDANASVCARLRENEGLEAIEGSLPHPQLAGRSFEVVSLWQSLEHVPDPVAVLRAARELLVPGGLLLVAVPAWDSWNFQRFGTAWYGLDMPRHLVHFTQPTLRRMIESAGFATLACRRILHTEWLRRSAVNQKRVRASRLDAWLSTRWGARMASFWIHRVWNQSDCLYVKAQAIEPSPQTTTG